MAVLSGSAGLDHVTVSGNTAGGSGGGLYAAAGSTVSIDNSILWNNGTTEIGSFDNVATAYSIVAGGADGAMDEDPLFVNAPALDFSLRPRILFAVSLSIEPDLRRDLPLLALCSCFSLVSWMLFLTFLIVFFAVFISCSMPCCIRFFCCSN